jgi:hypothetical protein
MDTSISMAGWGISYFCQKLSMRAVIYYPKRKGGGLPHNLEEHTKKWASFGAVVRPLERPNRLSINWYRARKQLVEEFPGAVMLEQGLPFEETVEEVAGELCKTPAELLTGTLVSCIGSGTMLAGVLRGLWGLRVNPVVYGVLVSPKDPQKILQNICVKACTPYNPPGTCSLFASPKIHIIDTGAKYEETATVNAPFPCNAYYDAKAWGWVVQNYAVLKKPVLFWNIGA